MRKILPLFIVILLLVAGCEQAINPDDDNTLKASDIQSETPTKIQPTPAKSFIDPAQKILFTDSDTELLKTLWPLDRKMSEFGELASMDLMTFDGSYIINFDIYSSKDFDVLKTMLKKYVKGEWTDDKERAYVFNGVAGGVKLTQCTLNKDIGGNLIGFTVYQNTGYDNIYKMVESHWPKEEAEWLQEVATEEPENTMIKIDAKENSIAYYFMNSDMKHDFNWLRDYFKDYADYAYQPKQGDDFENIAFSIGETKVTLSNIPAMDEVEIGFSVVPKK